MALDLDFILKIWPVLLGFLAGYGGYVSLQNSVKKLEEKTAEQEKKHLKERDKLWDKLEAIQVTSLETQKSIVRIETKMENLTK